MNTQPDPTSIGVRLPVHRLLYVSYDYLHRLRSRPHDNTWNLDPVMVEGLMERLLRVK